MTALAFLVGVVLVFAVLLVYETSTDSSLPRLRQYGLVAWISTGNWPAKVGAVLLLIGFGALIRYVLLYADVPAEIKLGSGIVLSALLGLVAYGLRDRQNQRAVYLALVGAAHGVAYLTAYSAYGFFGYVNDVTGLALLVLVACASGVFAVAANAASTAVLAMVGAFAAPAFAIGTPGPLIINSYYLAVSALSFVLVLVRGWRALIHLSFLFTLGGALFFGWTHEFFRPEHYAVMQPMLVALVALHLVMPLAERRAVRGKWLLHFDIGYFVALSLTAAILTLAIVPNPRQEGVIGFFALGVLWAVAGGVLRWLKLEESARHLRVAILFFIVAALLFIHDVPWLLAGLVIFAGLLLLAPRLGLGEQAQNFLCGAVLLLSAFHVLASLLEPRAGTALFNQVFAERLVAIAVLWISSYVGYRRRLALTPVLAVIAIAWTAISLGIEVVELQWPLLPQFVHAMLVVIAIGIVFVASARSLPSRAIAGLAVLIIATAWWSAPGAPAMFVFAVALLTPLSLGLLAWRFASRPDGDEAGGTMSAALLFSAVIPWADRLAVLWSIPSPFFVHAIAIGAILLSVVMGVLCKWQSAEWRKSVLPLYFWGVTIALGLELLIYIDRGVWPVLFELFSLSILLTIAYYRRREDSVVAAHGVIIVAAIALVLQAMLLRAFGPPGVLSVLDIGRMELPAVISLMWAIFGAGLCLWGVRVQSRTMWMVGAIGLVLSAGKLVFFDFGSLGELGNIIALIASGFVFLLVAWLAPIPPREKKPEGINETSDSAKEPSGTDH